MPQWLAARADGRRPTQPSGSPGSVNGRSAHLGDLIGWACTINEPNIVALWAICSGCSPPGSIDADRRRAVNDAFCGAHRLRSRSCAAGRGIPGRAYAVDDRLPGRGRGRGAAATRSGGRWRTCSWRRPQATTSSACRLHPDAGRPDGGCRPKTGCRHPDGLRVLARGARGRSAGPGT